MVTLIFYLMVYGLCWQCDVALPKNQLLVPVSIQQLSSSYIFTIPTESSVHPSRKKGRTLCAVACQKPNSYSFVEVSEHILASSQTCGFRIQCLHYKLGVKSVSRGDCELLGGKLFRLLSQLRQRIRSQLIPHNILLTSSKKSTTCILNWRKKLFFSEA